MRPMRGANISRADVSNMAVFQKTILVCVLGVGLVCMYSSNARAQSSDQSLPTPVTSNEINGTIQPLDIGDSRLTRHFYAFEANPGDLVITMDSRNLNGDIDVFTAVTFRPLMKTTMYASGQAPEITKSIYLRAHQIVILRVEARSPNDDPGTYHIKLRGTFEPFSGGIPVAEATESTAETVQASRGTKRVTSVGATIPEPPKPVTAKAEPTPSSVVAPTPAANVPARVETPKESAAKKTDAPAKASARSTTKPAPRSTGRRAPARNKPATSTTDSAKNSSKESKPTKKETPAKKPPAESEAKSAAETKSTAEKPPQETLPPQPSAHLIIEQKDGTRIDHPMSTVRRVLVEGNVIVVVMKTGRIERVPLSAVNRMSIEPQ